MRQGRPQIGPERYNSQVSLCQLEASVFRIGCASESLRGLIKPQIAVTSPEFLI